MFHIIQSNRMEVLQTQFHSLLKAAPLASPFETEIVLVQSPGMSQWLKLGLAESLGVAAQVDFPLPSSFIWRLYQQFLPNVPSESPFKKMNMTWKLVTLLPSCLNNELYSQLAHYLEDDEEGLKLFTLCEKIADVFDQYLMYRPNWIATWDQGKDKLSDVDVNIAPWQPDLWRKLVAHTENLQQSDYHRANMHHHLLAALESAKSDNLPQRISIFGLSAMATSQLEIFQALARKTTVLLFFFNPSEHYWGDNIDEKTKAKIAAKFVKMPELEAVDEQYYFVGNPLLSSWGKLGKDYFDQLLQLDVQWLDCFDNNFSDNLLGKLQSEIYELAFKGQSLVTEPQWFINEEAKLPLNLDDTSVHLQDCHTPLREVEALHDHLLRLFHQDPTLTPKDIIVMMPDVGSYSPYIEAVFGGAAKERFIPYALADLAIDQEKPVLNSFITLVNLPFSRFGVSDIMDLLAVTPIAEQFGIQDSEFDQLTYWLERVGVKWAIDGEHKTEYALPAMELNTWQHGLEKLLLGVAQGNEETPFSGIFAADEVEGMAVNTLSKLYHFVSCLMQFKKRLNTQIRLVEKAAILRELLGVFYSPDSEQSWDLLLLENVIDDLQKHDDNLDIQDPVSAKVVSYIIKQSLQERGVGQRFLVGSVNMCSLMPMRAVPFKVVCMLGLNDADFPRSVQPMGFDLVPHSIRQKGDRSRKFDERYLFLEALLSAREHLYLSYVGRSCFNNEAQVPSLLVNELFEYIDRSFYYPSSKIKPSAHLTHQSALQPFNSLYYQADSPLQSFNPVWLIDSEYEAPPQPSSIDLEPPKEIELSNLIRTVLSPQESFYQQTIGLRLPEINLEDKDEEPFTLDTLSRYFYLDELLECTLKGQPVEHLQILQRGNLPQSQVGNITLDKLCQRIAPMAEKLCTVLKSHKEPTEVKLTLNNVEIVGWLNKLYGDKQVFYRSASIKAKDKIRAFIMHCVANAFELHITTEVYGLDDKVSFAPLQKADAMGFLSTWLAFYLECLTYPVPFFVNSAFEYANTQDIKKANNKFAGGQYIGYGDIENPYVALNFVSLTDIEEEFIQLSDNLLSPIIELAQEQSHADA